ncbi:hypothetical protein N7447_006259 [Penicillium robsamsonii]|uniref:uncharacterized protein n=1 Tax=Penicillium robsamsonii TaxID=1792511 RepID=UPI002546805D|nr:uncharacterized protein N7447_006259 [Penicillium robsamsonii]KAJ5823919.1 hypothetical protein N7447_006259 [Penicillium robsamsonii]
MTPPRSESQILYLASAWTPKFGIFASPPNSSIFPGSDATMSSREADPLPLAPEIVSRHSAPTTHEIGQNCASCS